MSATSLSFIFKTVFRRSQRPFWFFSVTRVANLALSNSFFLLVVAERNGRYTHNPPVTVSHVAGMSTNSEQVPGARASIPRSLTYYLGLLRFFLTVGGGLGGQIFYYPLEFSTTSWQGSFVVVEKLLSTPMSI